MLGKWKDLVFLKQRVWELQKAELQGIHCMDNKI